MKYIYVVTMYRWGDREKHSYVLGVYTKERIAREKAAEEEFERGGKYDAHILRFEPNNPTSKKSILFFKKQTKKESN